MSQNVPFMSHLCPKMSQTLKIGFFGWILRIVQSMIKPAQCPLNYFKRYYLWCVPSD